jgi:hypothetical protein
MQSTEVNYTTITFLHSIHPPVLYLKYNVSETGVCLRLQVEPAVLGKIDKTILYLQAPATNQLSL